jgi:hypothetical protein
MENRIRERMRSVQLGEAQFYKNITIVPLIAQVDGTFQYDTLGEALATGALAVTEVSNSGSVPELLVVNRGNKSVLLLDGEELAGAKQNRVLNTSILLKEESETKIPVSCTEHGRWAYGSKAFSESGHVMAYKSRSRKTSSVHFFLKSSGAHQSDQAEVWDGIAELQGKAGAKSPTSAMSDVYKAREDALRKGDELFKPLPNQAGMLAFINGAPVGVDLVSRPAAYARLHPKLVRSYTLEGLLERPATSSEGETPLCPPAEVITFQARQFLDEITTAEEQQFPSVGYGTDHRFKGKDLAGTVLVHENEVIHAAFFRLQDNKQREDRLASYLRRQRHFSA